MPVISDTYKSISAPSEGLFKDQGSRFLAFAHPVERVEQVKDLLEDARRKYHDARHHCVAFRLGREGEVWRASDDGEPAGSAGRQILSEIDSAGLSDVAVIVVRYFGGIKLGIPGLIRAYRGAAQDALSSARVVEKIAGEWLRIDFPYSSMPQVMKVVKDMNLPQRSQLFEEQCSMEVRLRLSVKDDFFERTKNIDNFKYCNLI